MLASIPTLTPSRSNGCSSAAVMRCATRAPPSRPPETSSTANSSPPNRAIVSLGRITAASRSASSTSSSSPKWCPSVSLTSLNWSRSSTRTTGSAPERAAADRACRARSMNRVRLGSPVSASCTACFSIARRCRRFTIPSRPSASSATARTAGVPSRRIWPFAGHRGEVAGGVGGVPVLQPLQRRLDLLGEGGHLASCRGLRRVVDPVPDRERERPAGQRLVLRLPPQEGGQRGLLVVRLRRRASAAAPGACRRARC